MRPAGQEYSHLDLHKRTLSQQQDNLAGGVWIVLLDRTLEQGCANLHWCLSGVLISRSVPHTAEATSRSHLTSLFIGLALVDFSICTGEISAQQNQCLCHICT